MPPDWTRYQAVVGKDWEYYAPRFERCAAGARMSWHWAAFLGTLAWLRYRKLYAWSWAYFFVSAPVFFGAYVFMIAGTDTCALAISPETYRPWFRAVGIAALLPWIVPPILADWLYFRHVRAIVESGKAAASAGQGGVFGALALQGLFAFTLFMTAAQFSTYRYSVFVRLGLNEADVLREPMEAYLRQHQRLPSRIEEIATKGAATRYVREVSLAPGGGLRATFNERAEGLVGRSVQWDPKFEGNAIKEWSCLSVDLPDICLPTRCRKR